MESVSEYLDDQMIKEIITVYADKGLMQNISMYLMNRNIVCCISYKTNSKFSLSNNNVQNNNYNKTRFAVERFFAWLKNGFHRTRIHYEKKCDNYLGFVYLVSIMMYWRVFG